MKILNIALLLIAVILAYFLYDMINAPIQFDKLRKERYEAIRSKLEDIKTAQMAYKDIHREFAPSFDQLIQSIKNDSLMLIKVIGNPDDTSQVVQRDTSYTLALNEIFGAGYPIDKLAFIPNTDNKKFELSAGEITSNNVKVKVFEVSTTNRIIFSNVDEKRFYEPEEKYVLGSMMEATFNIKEPIR